MDGAYQHVVHLSVHEQRFRERRQVPATEQDLQQLFAGVYDMCVCHQTIRYCEENGGIVDCYHDCRGRHPRGKFGHKTIFCGSDRDSVPAHRDRRGKARDPKPQKAKYRGHKACFSVYGANTKEEEKRIGGDRDWIKTVRYLVGDVAISEGVCYRQLMNEVIYRRGAYWLEVQGQVCSTRPRTCPIVDKSQTRGRCLIHTLLICKRRWGARIWSRIAGEIRA